MLKIHSRDKERMKMLCANRRLCVFPPGDLYFIPMAIGFTSSGAAWVREAGVGWRKLAGAVCFGPCASDHWTF